MMQLVLTVMAIGLAALLAVGGINYFSTDIGVRVEVSQALRAQHDAIASAASSYRTANNGFVASDIGKLSGYLPNGEMPKFPKDRKPFVWSISKDMLTGKVSLCLSRVTAADVPGNAEMEGVLSFAKDRLQRVPDSVRYGIGCAGARNGPVAFSEGVPVEEGGPLDVSFISKNSGASLSFEGF